MREQHFLAGFHSEPLYTKLYNPRWPHSPEEHKLEMEVDVERLRMETLLSQLTPPLQCHSSPQRAPAVDTRSDEPGTPQKESQPTKREGNFRLQASVDGFLYVSISLDQKSTIFLLQPDVGVDENDEATTSEVQAGACKEFARLPIGRQQRDMASTEQSKQFDPGGRQRSFLLSVKNGFHCASLCPCVSYFSLHVFFCLVQKQILEARVIFTGCESGRDANQMRELLYQD